ncbi:MAG TPA: peptidyl-tRNA hydrolase Pth2 [Thermoplasmataceae archaeon]|nr:peptidyl-tRNA hydrolase Pth2 [Thermoplasmatales archaeon AK]HLH86598.1 peptidyl-tRNA hydrolase Pth2 [Thermoplasmataceae archaeon]
MVEEIKLVVAVRKDLDLGKGKIAAQVAHAAVSCALKSEKHDKRTFRKWLDQGQKKIVVKVDSEQVLLSLLDRARQLGLISEPIYDAGHTQVEPGTLTCIGIGPADGKLLDELTGGYSLL